MPLSDYTHEARIAVRSAADAASGLFNPTVRLGVTGLARAGKSVFITALVNALLEGGRFPTFRPMAERRLAHAAISPQPDDAIPRFEIEAHLHRLLGERQWPESTRRISELRLVLDFQPTGFWRQRSGIGRLTLDIVDYPGEWLLDLALLDQSFRDWSARTIAASRGGSRAALAAPWHALLDGLDPNAPQDEATARRAAELFTGYLRACREARYALSTLPPGRFLLPGDMEGSPALTFAPLGIAADAPTTSGSLFAMMERRYEAYRAHVVRPFFRNHFARLDRQIVLVDVLAALNAGPEAVSDLETALGDVLSAFRVGRNSWLGGIFRPRADRVLFAATKADHLHHTSHDRLERILGRLVQRATSRAETAGAGIDVIALSAVRATREGTARRGKDELPIIIGTPEAGEVVHGRVFDGKEEVAMFPGDLPDDPEVALSPAGYRGFASSEDPDLRFVRFRPARLEAGSRRLPHIRLDRAMQFLLGDHLR